jgi:hypothetical protein
MFSIGINVLLPLWKFDLDVPQNIFDIKKVSKFQTSVAMETESQTFRMSCLVQSETNFFLLFYMQFKSCYIVLGLLKCSTTFKYGFMKMVSYFFIVLFM